MKITLTIEAEDTIKVGLSGKPDAPASTAEVKQYLGERLDVVAATLVDHGQTLLSRARDAQPIKPLRVVSDE